jgi:hypothetical protein
MPMLLSQGFRKSIQLGKQQELNQDAGNRRGATTPDPCGVGTINLD